MSRTLAATPHLPPFLSELCLLAHFLVGGDHAHGVLNSSVCPSGTHTSSSLASRLFPLSSFQLGTDKHRAWGHTVGRAGALRSPLGGRQVPAGIACSEPLGTRREKPVSGCEEATPTDSWIRKQTHSCRWMVQLGVGQKGEGDEEVRIHSCDINKSRGCGCSMGVRSVMAP